MALEPAPVPGSDRRRVRPSPLQAGLGVPRARDPRSPEPSRWSAGRRVESRGAGKGPGRPRTRGSPLPGGGPHWTHRQPGPAWRRLPPPDPRRYSLAVRAPDRRAVRVRGEPLAGRGRPSTYDLTRWFQLHVRHTSTTCTANSVKRVASRTSSSALRADPDTAPRWSPNTQDTSVNCSLRQIGHITELGFPWNLAARSR